MRTVTGIVVFTSRNCALVRSNYVCIQENALLQRLHTSPTLQATSSLATAYGGADLTQ